MAKHPHDVKGAERDRPVITTAMIEAGVTALVEQGGDDLVYPLCESRLREMVGAVFSSMQLAM